MTKAHLLDVAILEHGYPSSVITKKNNNTEMYISFYRDC